MAYDFEPLVCGVTGRPIKRGDTTQPVRIHQDDIEPGDTGHDGQPLKPGLYKVSGETMKKFVPRIVKRLMRTPLIGDDGKPVLELDENNHPLVRDGKLVYKPTITDPSQAAGFMLM
jgi:hypothetical protein